MNKIYIANWTTAATLIAWAVGYTISLVWLNDEFLAVHGTILALCLLVPQWFYANNMPTKDIVISTAAIWTLVFVTVTAHLLFTGEIYNITIVNNIICHFTCPR